MTVAAGEEFAASDYAEDDDGSGTHQWVGAEREGTIERTVTPHDLRRTVASLLAERGVNQRVAMEYLGHTNISTTAKYYQAVRPDTLRAVVATLRPTGTAE